MNLLMIYDFCLLSMRAITSSADHQSSLWYNSVSKAEYIKIHINKASNLSFSVYFGMLFLDISGNFCSEIHAVYFLWVIK